MLPRKFLDRMQQMLGDEYEAFLAAFEQERYQALRLNALKTGINGRSAADIQRGQDSNTVFLHTEFLHLSKVPWAENGYYYGAADQPGKHPYHAAGVYYIQEPSAMAPVELLEVLPGERVLDLCAAPGGKSTQIAAKMDGRGFLLCNEVNGARAKILSENVERMGIVNAYVTNETPARLAEIFPEYFDKILVDAPCSGEGMFRKNEAACEEWSPENVSMCANRQDEILDCAARMLRPGGKLVYSTCTFAPVENEGSVHRFLERHTEFELLPIKKKELELAGCDGSADYLRVSMGQSAESSSKEIADKCAESSSKEIADKCTGSGQRENTDQYAVSGQERNVVQCVESYRQDNAAHHAEHLEYTLRLWPHKIKGEGHFAALFQKRGELPEGYLNNSANGFVTGASYKELGEYIQFCQEIFGKKELPVKQDEQSEYIKFGDNIYMVSSLMPSVKGLKILRPGLHVGTLKKNRFEPSHALALALSPKEVRNVWNLDFEVDLNSWGKMNSGESLDNREETNLKESPDNRERINSGKNTVTAYLNGQTFPAQGEKGWYLICVDGFSIGWGKLSGGMMKNHYPKGLRINI